MGRKLYLTEHAKARMSERNISDKDIMQIIKYGQRRDNADNTITHWSTKNNIGVVIDWRQMFIITVFRMSIAKHNKFMRSLIQKKKEQNA